MHEHAFTGNIPRIINNNDCLYEGDLRHYLKVIFEAPNIHHGYHGLRHMLHVTWACYEACLYYAKLGKLDTRRRRNLLIAALLHDYGHAGKSGDDAANIKVAIEALVQHLLPEDAAYTEEIISILGATQFPHADLGKEITLEQAIIRDADMSQAFGVVWIGDILAGFGNELGKTPKEMLLQQQKFLSGLKFHSDFGRVFYGEAAIKAKIGETLALLDILD
jgi:hypothetical protein